MTWTKTKNLFSRDPADPAAEQNLLDTNMLGTMWGSATPASAKEDSVIERIALDTFRRNIRRNGQSGFLTRPTYLFSGGYPANSFHMPKADVYLDGLGATIVGTLIGSDTEGLLQLTAPPVSGTRQDLMFLEVWITEVPGSTASAPVTANKPDATHVFKWGNVEYGGTNPSDDINEVNFEIRRRAQLQYRIRTTPGVNFALYPNGVNDPGNSAQGPNASPTALTYTVSPTDPTLYIAGNGTVSHQGILGTLDGFVYAIPLAQVGRATGVTAITAPDVIDLRLLWGGSSGTLATLSGTNRFTGQQQFAQGADLAPGSGVINVGSDGNLFKVNGAGPFTGITTMPAGTEFTFLFPSAVNLVHNDTTFYLPYRRIYRTVANELITFMSIGTGWVIKSRSGPSACVGTSEMFNGGTVPDGYLLEYKQSLLATTFEGLLTEYLASGFVSASAGVPGAALWSTFTANASTDEISVTGHGKVAGDVVFFANVGGAMPGNVSAYTKYFVHTVTGVNTFKITATRGASAIDITTNGTGTLNAYDHFYAGDMGGRVAMAIDNLGGVVAGRVVTAFGSILGGGGGEELHTMLLTELVPHTHSIPIKSGSPGYDGASAQIILGTSQTGSAGSGVPFNIMQPTQAKIFMVRA